MMEVAQLSVTYFVLLGLVSSVEFIYFSEVTTGYSIINHNETNGIVLSLLDCGRLCLIFDNCYAVTYECEHLVTEGQGTCYIKSGETPSEPYEVAPHTSSCYMKVAKRFPHTSNQSMSTIAHSINPAVTSQNLGVSANDPTGLPTVSEVTSQADSSEETTQNLVMSANAATALSMTTSPTSPTIVDAISVKNMCTATSGDDDLAVVMTDGYVYFYDNMIMCSSGPCKKRAVSAVFTGFTLPDIAHWQTLMTCMQNYIDLYTDTGMVYRWQINSGSLSKDSNFPKGKNDYFWHVYSAVPNQKPPSPQFAVYRQALGSQDIYFYDVSGQFYYYSNQDPKEATFVQSDTSLLNMNGHDINAWKNLPAGTVAVTGLDNHGSAYMAITNTFQVYYLTTPSTLLPGYFSPASYFGTFRT